MPTDPTDRPMKRPRMEKPSSQLPHSKTSGLNTKRDASESLENIPHTQWWSSATQWAILDQRHEKETRKMETHLGEDEQGSQQALIDADFLASLPRCEVVKTPAQRAQILFPNLQPLSAVTPVEIVDISTINRDGASMLVSECYLEITILCCFD